MKRQRTTRARIFVVGFALLLLTPPASAVITRVVSLREVLATEQLIFMAKVAKLDTAQSLLLLQITDDLKGKAAFRTLRVHLTPDRQGEREDDRPKLLKRLAPELSLVVFASKRGPRYTAFAYTNGTWFQLLGQVGDEPQAIRWTFTHCEPYLRRTFQGSTAALRQVVIDGLAGKKQPPEPDAQAEPGLGPEIPPQPKKTEPGMTSRSAAGPLLAVIPTFVLFGPLALLATLLPAIFGGLMLWARRWGMLLGVASLSSTLHVGYSWFHGALQARGWGHPALLWGTMALVAFVGMLCSWRRPLAGESREPGSVRRWMLLGLGSLLGVILGLVCVGQWELYQSPWLELILLGTLAWTVAVALSVNPSATRRQGPLRTEAVMLGAMTLTCAGIAITWPAGLSAGAGVRLVWSFEPSPPSALLSSPVLDEQLVYVAAIQSGGFSPRGVVYGLDRENGGVRWQFDDEGTLQQIFSSPCLAAGRLYVGEGLHENQDCRFYCLDAATGQRVWQFASASHIESSPCVWQGQVYFGAGDDGLYCLDAQTGALRWHFQEAVHIDASPLIVGNRLYVGSGVSRTHQDTAIFCLDADRGTILWRRPVALPAWGAPAASGEQVLFGLGNGRYDRSADRPAGAFLCVDGRTGQEVWRRDLDDAVLGAATVQGKAVYVGCRDRHIYCLSRDTGALSWRVNLGSPVVTRLPLAEDRLYAVASAGQMQALDAQDGAVRWTVDLARLAHGEVVVFASPAWARSAAQDKGRLYVAASVTRSVGRQAVLYCFEESERMLPMAVRP